MSSSFETQSHCMFEEGAVPSGRAIWKARHPQVVAGGGGGGVPCPKVFLTKALGRAKDTEREDLGNLNNPSSIPSKPIASRFYFPASRPGSFPDAPHLVVFSPQPHGKELPRALVQRKMRPAKPAGCNARRGRRRRRS